MNLLPKLNGELIQKDYWKIYLKLRGKEAFLWEQYGTKKQQYNVIQKYISTHDNVIIVGGCENSPLSADLYNAGFTSITNINKSQTVVQNWTNQYHETHPDMKFAVMDSSQINFKEESFSSFIDNGTFDFLFINSDFESAVKAKSLFAEVERVLKVGGSFICVSLLQGYTLECLTSYFHHLGWKIRVCQCEEVENQVDNLVLKERNLSEISGSRLPFPTFVVVCIKSKNMEHIAPLLEFSPCEENIEIISSVRDLNERVRSVQQFTILSHQICHEHRTTQDVFIELMDPKSSMNTPKYTLYVVDGQADPLYNRFAALIVPRGRETDSLCDSYEGRRKLADIAECQRLLIIHLGPDYQCVNLECIQKELRGIVSSFKPEELLSLNTQVPFLLLDSRINQRKEIHRGFSDLTGEYVVEEVEKNGDDGKTAVFRRLIFLSTPTSIQSEIKFSNGKIDLQYLSKYHFVMVDELRHHVDSFSPGFERVLVIGLGSGGLCSYIQQTFPQLSVDGIEIDPIVEAVAKKYFDFNPNENLKSHVADGLSFVRDFAASDERCSCIIIDVNCPDSSLEISFPPPSFLEPSFIDSMKTCLCANGLVLMNLSCLNEVRHRIVLETLRESFASVHGTKVEEEGNSVITCLLNLPKQSGAKKSPNKNNVDMSML